MAESRGLVGVQGRSAWSARIGLIGMSLGLEARGQHEVKTGCMGLTGPGGWLVQVMDSLVRHLM
jgi:hypothetical protein